MDNKQMDFSAIATKYNTKCTDGLTILKGSFAHQDGMTVPMVYQHNHTDINNVIGHCLLKEKEEGVRLYAYLNPEVEAGRKAKSLIQHGDIKAVSIYANGLQKDPTRKYVQHGNIKEVSIVLSPANPEAIIDFVALEHSDGTVDISEEEGTIYNGDNIIEVYHSDNIDHADKENDKETGNDNKDIEELISRISKVKLSEEEIQLLSFMILKMVEGDPSTKEEKDMIKTEFEKLPKDKQEYFTYMIGAYSEENKDVKHDDINDEDDDDVNEDNDDNNDNIDHSDKDNSNSNKDIEELISRISKVKLSEEEIQLLSFMILKMVEGDPSTKEEKDMIKTEFEKLPKDKQEYFTYMIGAYSEENKNNKNKDNEGGKNMGTINQSVFDNQNDNVLSHAEIKEIFADAKQLGSLKEAVLSHAAAGTITGIENLYPDFKMVEDPSTIKRDDSFVSIVLNEVTKKPFAKLKSVVFNITATEARAKGYVKGNRKVEEVITALKRETPPQTIYKKQKLDRDDIVDITSFDIVAYLKKELLDMLKEEEARAILIGDGRLPDAEDKIREQNIRPIVSDDATYTIRQTITIAANATNKDIADEIIEKALRARKNYKGSGSPMLFMSPDYLTTMLLAQDSIGRRVYNNESELASALRVSKIVETSVMEGATYNDATSSKVYDIIGVIVNLKDYAVGADKLGEVAMFDDFDINYNQMVYLVETRCSGALIKPYSAIVLLKEQTNAAG